MFRTSDTLLIAVMVAAAAFTYKTKHEAEDRLGEIRRIEAQIRIEQDTISLLQADWSLLTQPSRLQDLVKAFQGELGLGTVNPRQFVSFEDIPMRPAPEPEPAVANGEIAAAVPAKPVAAKTAAAGVAQPKTTSAKVAAPGVGVASAKPSAAKTTVAGIPTARPDRIKTGSVAR